MARASTGTTKRRAWSYSAGERGRNRVRVYERPDRAGEILLQYAERGLDGRLDQRRQSLGAIPRGAAKGKADELAARFATLGPSTQAAPLTLDTLFDNYRNEVSRHKGASKRGHDLRCAEMFTRYFGRP